MSDVIEKTLASLPGIVGGLGVTPSKGGFQNFVKNVMASRTKYEEDQVLLREVSLQKQKLSQPSLSMAQKRDSLVRLLYCHMLGKDVSFVCIHAVKLAQQGSILQKKVGYLVCSMLMSEDHELVMLLVNTMQKDLMSTNILHNLASLTAISHLCTAEMVPAMLPLVKDKLSHERDVVRKRAVLCLHHFLHRAPEMVTHDTRVLRAALSDSDPSVVWATVNVYCELVKVSPGSYMDLVPGLLGILGQVIGRRLSTDYDYHTVPAPWLTIVLLRALGYLGAHSHSASQEIYPMLKEVLQKTEPSHKMGLAVIFECLQTIARIAPHPQLVDHAVSSVGRFLSAKSINLKYLGLKALVSMATISPNCTLEHQEVVLDCLEHHDVTIQRQTLELLYKMANSSNVQVISAKMLEFMNKSRDSFIRLDIITKVTELTQRFSDNLLWYIRTMNIVIQAAEDAVPSNTADTMMRTISTGCVGRGDESDPLSDKVLRGEVFNLYWQLLQQERLPPAVTQVAVWVVGEYSHCVPSVTPSTVVSALVHVYQATFDLSALEQIVVSLQKLSYYITDGTKIMSLLQSHKGMTRSLVQRIDEFENLCKAKQIMKVACNPETRPDVKQLDFSLSFLDEFVCEALENGAQPYRTKSFREYKPTEDPTPSSHAASLSFAPYQAPVHPHKALISSQRLDTSVTMDTWTSGNSGGSSSHDNREGLVLKSTRKVWGPEGLIKEESPEKPVEETTESKTSCPRQSAEPEIISNQTPEQRKRDELASALFGAMQVEESNKKIGSKDLVSLASVEPILSPANQNIETNDHVECENKSENYSVAKSTVVPSAELPSEDFCRIGSNTNMDYPSEPEPVGAFATPPAVPPSHLNSGGWAKMDQSSLLSNLTLQSPEDQVISGSMYDNFTDADMDYVEVPSSSNKFHQELNKSASNNVQDGEKTMYDDMQISFASGTSDDFVRTYSRKMEADRTKDSHPSPWKMLGPRLGNKPYDESTEDSLSIEVDSIEDEEPPLDFIVDSPQHVSKAINKTVPPKCGVLEALEPLPKSQSMVLLDKDGYVLRCQKVYRTDSLVLVLHFTLENQDHENTAAQNVNFGSIQIENMLSYDIKLQPITDSMIPGKNPQPIPIPGTTVVALAPECTAYSTDPHSVLDFTVKLPVSDTPVSCSMDVDVTDFMRPSVLSMELFGELWSRDHFVIDKTTSERGQGQVERLQDMGFRVIQTIGKETIFAASWLDSTNNVILAHCKHGQDKVHVSVKGQHRQIVSSLIEIIKSENERS